jgi:hypothetical protein
MYRQFVIDSQTGSLNTGLKSNKKKSLSKRKQNSNKGKEKIVKREALSRSRGVTMVQTRPSPQEV